MCCYSYLDWLIGSVMAKYLFSLTVGMIDYGKTLTSLGTMFQDIRCADRPLCLRAIITHMTGASV